MMPAKVVEPNGNQNVNGIENCGYLERADKPLDDQDALERIPFINNLNLEYGDLVVYDAVPNCPVHVKVKDKAGEDVVIKGNITMAVVTYNPNDADTWDNKDFKKEWANWSKVTNNKIIYRLKLKDGVTPEKISKIKNKEEYEANKQKK